MKPIGSEKIQNPDEKLKRILEIAGIKHDNVIKENCDIESEFVKTIVNGVLDKQIEIDELVAYKTSCKKSNIVLEDNSVFIFTSPSSVECFFKQYIWNNTYKAIVIGKTTANYLPADINYKISPLTSIEECIKLAKSELL